MPWACKLTKLTYFPAYRGLTFNKALLKQVVKAESSSAYPSVVKKAMVSTPSA